MPTVAAASIWMKTKSTRMCDLENHSHFITHSFLLQERLGKYGKKKPERLRIRDKVEREPFQTMGSKSYNV